MTETYSFFSMAVGVGLHVCVVTSLGMGTVLSCYLGGLAGRLLLSFSFVQCLISSITKMLIETVTSRVTVVVGAVHIAGRSNCMIVR